MSEQLTLIDCQKLTLSLSDFLVRICQLLEKEGDYPLQEVAYFLKQCELLGLRDPNILSLKTSKVFSQAMKEETGLPFYEKLPTLGMMVNGNYLIQGGYCPKIESGYSLLDILEDNINQKYFLSEKALQRFQRRGMGKILQDVSARETSQEKLNGTEAQH